MELEQALATIYDLREDLRAKEVIIENLREEIDTYEALAEEALDDNIVPDTLLCIQRDRTTIEGEYQLGSISGQARDIFMGYTTKYMKMLNG